MTRTTLDDVDKTPLDVAAGCFVAPQPGTPARGTQIFQCRWSPTPLVQAEQIGKHRQHQLIPLRQRHRIYPGVTHKPNARDADSALTREPPENCRPNRPFRESCPLCCRVRASPLWSGVVARHHVYTNQEALISHASTVFTPRAHLRQAKPIVENRRLVTAVVTVFMASPVTAGTWATGPPYRAHRPQWWSDN